MLDCPLQGCKYEQAAAEEVVALIMIQFPSQLQSVGAETALCILRHNDWDGATR